MIEATMVGRVGETRGDEPEGVRALAEELRGLGLWEVIADEEVTDVVVNEDGSVVVTGFAGVERLEGRLDPLALESCLGTLAGLRGEVLHERSPILETSLPFHRVRVEAILPPVSRAPVVSLRRPPTRLLTLDDLEASGSVSPEARRILMDAVLEGRTVLISGGVSSGKTVLASALLSELVEAIGVRLVVCEEGAREVMLPEGADACRLLTSPAAGVTMTRLVRTALRLNPDRIVVGEVRGAEALDMVKAANTGHPGVATIHANSAPDALDRLHDLVAESGTSVALRRVVSAVDLVAHLRRDGHRRRLEAIFESDPGESAVEVIGRIIYDRHGRTVPRRMP